MTVWPKKLDLVICDLVCLKWLHQVKCLSCMICGDWFTNACIDAWWVEEEMRAWEHIRELGALSPWLAWSSRGQNCVAPSFWIFYYLQVAALFSFHFSWHALFSDFLSSLLSSSSSRPQTRGYCASVHKSYFGSLDQKTSLIKVVHLLEYYSL